MTNETRDNNKDVTTLDEKTMQCCCLAWLSLATILGPYCHLKAPTLQSRWISKETYDRGWIVVDNFLVKLMERLLVFENYRSEMAESGSLRNALSERVDVNPSASEVHHFGSHYCIVAIDFPVFTFPEVKQQQMINVWQVWNQPDLLNLRELRTFPILQVTLMTKLMPWPMINSKHICDTQVWLSDNLA